jgi:signal peptidase II
MFMKSLIRISILLAVIMANIGCDQMSKNIVREHIESGVQIPVIDNHVILTKVENTGAMLSFGDTWPENTKKWFLLLMPSLALLMAMSWLFFQKSLGKIGAFSLACVIGGGIGNIFDRFLYGSVTDFCYIDLGVVHTGVFNCADLSITFGVLGLLFEQIRPSGKSQH